MSSAGRSSGLTRRCQVQLFFSCPMSQSVSRARRHLRVVAHRNQLGDRSLVLGASQVESPSAPHPYDAVPPRAFVGGLCRDSIERLVEQSYLALGPALHFESCLLALTGLDRACRCRRSVVVQSPACPAGARHARSTAIVGATPSLGLIGRRSYLSWNSGGGQPQTRTRSRTQPRDLRTHRASVSAEPSVCALLGAMGSVPQGGHPRGRVSANRSDRLRRVRNSMNEGAAQFRMA